MRHEHVASCWRFYDPCGEHHAHTYGCGNGELQPFCPDWKPPCELCKAPCTRFHARWCVHAREVFEPMINAERAKTRVAEDRIAELLLRIKKLEDELEEERMRTFHEDDA